MGERVPGGSAVKNHLANAGDVGSIPSWEDPLEKEMAAHSSVLAWRTPWTEEPDGLQSVGGGHRESDTAWQTTNLYLSIFFGPKYP